MCFYTYLIYNLIFYKYSSTITIKYKLHLPIYHPNNSQNTLYKDVSEFEGVTLTEKTMDLKLFHINYTHTHTYQTQTQQWQMEITFLHLKAKRIKQRTLTVHTRDKEGEVLELRIILWDLGIKICPMRNFHVWQLH